MTLKSWSGSDGPALILQTLLDEIPYAVAVFDKQLHYVAYSQRWLSDYHLPNKPLYGLSHYEVFPEISAEWKALHQQCLTGVTLSREAEPFQRQDGSLDYVSWKLVPWHDGKGRIAGIMMFTTVAPSHVIAEKKSQQYERELKVLLHTTKAIPWRYNLNTNQFSYISPQVEELLGYPTSSWYNIQTWASRIHPDDREQAVAQFRETTEQGIDHDLQYRAVTASGKTVWIHDAVTVSHDEAGVPVALTGIFFNISAQKAVEESLRHSEEQYRSVIELSGDGFWLVDMHGRLLEVNDSYARLSGYSKKELVGMHISDLEAKESPEETKQHIEYIIKNGNALFETQHKKKNGEVWDVEISTSFSHNQGGRFFVFARDITERKRTQEELRLIAKVFKNTGEGIVITDPNGIIVDVNDAYCSITGYSKEEMIGEKPNKIKSDRHDEEFYRQMWHAILTEGHWVGEIWDRRKNGEVFPKWLNINAVHDEHERLTHFVGIFSDISMLKDIERELEHLAYYDSLTKLPNRLLFRDRLDIVLNNCRRSHYQCAVLFLDVDRFKIINDSLGHTAGDELLIEVAKRIKSTLRESDTVARMGGDEFTILLSHIKSSDAAAIVAKTIMEALRKPAIIKGHEVRISSSIGIAIYPDDGTNFHSLTRHADAAMYEAKAAGRAQYRFFTAEMDYSANEHLEMERDLHIAIEENQFSLVFQPQINAQTGRVAHCEALIRWKHPKKGFIPPDNFIPVAEDTDLIHAIGDWVINEVCREIKHWENRLTEFPSVAINLSARQFRQERLVERIMAILEEHNVAVSSIEFEITETAAMENAHSTLQRLAALTEHGFSIAIDDFGTGYSSLSYLKLFPVNKLKLDHSFVRDIQSDENDAAISSAIIRMGNSLGLNVVAEGVETPEQRDFLMSQGCNIMQGYLYSKPLEASEFVEYLLSH